MKKLLFITAILTSASMSLASNAEGTYTLNAKCQAKVAKVSKALVEANLMKGAKIKSITVQPNVKAEEFEMATVTTDVQIIIQGEHESMSTSASIIDSKTDCLIQSILIQ